MSFRIARQTALIASGFRPALRRQLSRAIKELDISSRMPAGTRIHSARRRVKKVRSALRLLEAASFHGVTRVDHELLRDAAAQVAGSRNAEANLMALGRLCDETGCDNLRFSKTFARLELEKSDAERGIGDAMHRAVTLLKGSLSRIDAWDDSPIAWKKIARGVGRFYKSGRAAFRKAADDPSMENLHRWRKRTKDLLNGLKLAGDTLPKPVRRIARDAKKLSALLGADHDLAMLRLSLAGSGAGRETHVLGKLIDARRRKLQRKAMELGAECFARKPGAFEEKFGG
ncbi:MAG TPA: CHAD domain-containing protein [Chthoniobacteraceae bacterium]|nr:CHAD domain-containing protein [Chthoniobacteraceae bacterium]